MLFSFLAPELIPRQAIARSGHGFAAPLGDVLADQVAYDLAVAALARFSLVAAGPSVISAHRLVQLTMRMNLTAGERQDWAAATVRLLDDVFPSNPHDRSTWPACAPLVTHILVACSHAIEQDRTRLSAGFCTGQPSTRSCVNNYARQPNPRAAG